jgi:hypothetical protein
MYLLLFRKEHPVGLEFGIQKYKCMNRYFCSTIAIVGAFHGNLPLVTQTGIQETTH